MSLLAAVVQTGHDSPFISIMAGLRLERIAKLQACNLGVNGSQYFRSSHRATIPTAKSNRRTTEAVCTGIISSGETNFMAKNRMIWEGKGLSTYEVRGHLDKRDRQRTRDEAATAAAPTSRDRSGKTPRG
jgi:hypothetical protein